ncbi:MAG: class I SAM-dependent methyltransferase [Alphaproteobacteria bacterium]
MTDMYRTLGIEDLRARLLEHTRKAYTLLRLPEQPRILDIGCGRGLQTIELARLSNGKIIGIDIDNDVLSQMEQRIKQEGASAQITVFARSLYETGFDDESFDLLWEEGVLHLLDVSRSLRECNRLLKSGGYLVMHETVSWFEGIREKLAVFGFRHRHIFDHFLPDQYWWTEYGAPLEERIRSFREINNGAAISGELAQYEQEVAIIKADPSRLNCGFFCIQKSKLIY